MRAVRFHGQHDLRVEEIDTPRPGPRDVLLAPEAVGICGTDIHIVEGDYVSAPPVVLGHEIAATVLEVGSQVRGVRPGQLITVEPHIYCGVCFFCQNGAQHMCPDRRAPGVHLNGGMAERLVIPDTLAYAVPEGVEAWQAALTEPIACCIHGMDRLAPQSGLPLAVFGAGPIGSILVALARLAGLGPILVLDPLPGRRELAARFGADEVLDPTDPSIDAVVDRLTHGVGFPYLIDAVGSPRVIEQALGWASRGGRLLIVGVADPAATVAIHPQEVYAKELTILGTALNPWTHRRAANLLPALALDRMRPSFFALDDVEAAFAAQRAGDADKVIMRPQLV